MSTYYDALSAYDNAAKANHEGVSRQSLDQDEILLTQIGRDIDELAKRVARVCGNLHWMNERPAASRLALLMVEAIDGELSKEAWAVVRAAMDEKESM